MDKCSSPREKFRSIFSVPVTITDKTSTRCYAETVSDRELALAGHAQLRCRSENSRASRARRHPARFPQRQNLSQRRRLPVLSRQTSARSTATDRVLHRLVENPTPIQPDGKQLTFRSLVPCLNSG